MAGDRVVEADLGLVQAELVLAELETSSSTGHLSPAALISRALVTELALGHVAVVKGQLTGLAGDGGSAGSDRATAVPIQAHAYQRSPFDPFPAERTSQRALALQQLLHRVFAGQDVLPSPMVMRKVFGTRST